MHTYSLVIERKDEGGFSAHFPALPTCHAEGISYEGTVNAAEEALTLHIKNLLNDKTMLPEEDMRAPVTLSIAVRA